MEMKYFDMGKRKQLLLYSMDKLSIKFQNLQTEMVHCIRTYSRRRNVITKIKLVIRIKIESSFLEFQT